MFADCGKWKELKGIFIDAKMTDDLWRDFDKHDEVLVWVKLNFSLICQSKFKMKMNL